MEKTFKCCSVLLSMVIIISFLSSCGFSSNKNVQENKEKAYKYASMEDGVLHLDLDKSRHDSLAIDLSVICDSLIYIPLETNKNCLLGNYLSQICIDGDDVFLHVGPTVYRFKMNGDFVCQLGALGRGPGEYSCAGMTVNTDDKRVYAIANYRHSIFEFDYDGNLLNDKVKTDAWQNGILYFPLEKSLLYSFNYSLSTDKDIKTDYNMLTTFDLKGNKIDSIKSKYFPSKFFNGARGTRMHMLGSTKYLFDNSLCFQELASDTVFRKDSNSITPYIVLNNYAFRKPFTADLFPSNNDSDMFWMMERDAKFPSKVRGESSRYIFVDYYSEPSYVYDKKERTLSCIDYYKQKVECDMADVMKNVKYVYRNDMDGVNHIESTWVINNEFLMMRISAADFLDNIDKLKASKAAPSAYLKRMEKIAEGLTEESNPVFMLARLKK